LLVGAEPFILKAVSRAEYIAAASKLFPRLAHQPPQTTVRRRHPLDRNPAKGTLLFS
jgi:hypothetical protein